MIRFNGSKTMKSYFVFKNLKKNHLKFYFIKEMQPQCFAKSTNLRLINTLLISLHEKNGSCTKTIFNFKSCDQIVQSNIPSFPPVLETLLKHKEEIRF